MEIVNVRARKVLDGVRDRAWTQTGWLVFHVALTGTIGWIAVHGVDGVAPVLWWVLAGAVGSDAMNCARSTVAAWREHRRLIGCIRCVNLAADQDEADQRGRRCAQRGHMQAGPGQVPR